MNLPERVVRRFLAASALHWDVKDEENLHTEVALPPNGTKYEIRAWKGWSYVEVSFRSNPTAMYARDYLTKDGLVQRGGSRRTQLPSLEVARAAAEKHYALSMIEPETDPDKIIEKLTPAQKALILEAFENEGEIEPDYGTRSERPLRQLRTRLLKQLRPMGIFHPQWERLLPLGEEVAKKLK